MLLNRRCLTALALALASSSLHSAQFHDNVVIVLDASGSMRQNLKGTQIQKIDAAKSALKEVLKTVPPSTHVGLLVFSAKNLKDPWAYPLGPRDEEAFMRAVDLPKPDSGTPLGKFIKKGADRLLEEREKQFGYGSYRLLIVTDGEAQDRNLVNQFTPEIIARGITVDVIGVDMSSRHTLATQVHSYRAANDPAALQRAIAEVFAEVSSQNSDTTTEEIFDLIAPIPTETASAIIQTLATTGNNPIGEQPRASSPTKARPSASPSSSPRRAPTPRGQPTAWGILKIIAVIAITGTILMIALIAFLIKLASGRRRR